MTLFFFRSISTRSPESTQCVTLLSFHGHTAHKQLYNRSKRRSLTIRVPTTITTKRAKITQQQYILLFRNITIFPFFHPFRAIWIVIVVLRKLFNDPFMDQHVFFTMFLTCHHAKHGYSRETRRGILEQIRKQTHQRYRSPRESHQQAQHQSWKKKQIPFIYNLKDPIFHMCWFCHKKSESLNLLIDEYVWQRVQKYCIFRTSYFKRTRRVQGDVPHVAWEPFYLHPVEDVCTFIR